PECSPSAHLGADRIAELPRSSGLVAQLRELRQVLRISDAIDGTRPQIDGWGGRGCLPASHRGCLPSSCARFMHRADPSGGWCAPLNSPISDSTSESRLSAPGARVPVSRGPPNIVNRKVQ